MDDRPYVASPHLSVAIASVFGSAHRGQCKERPELVEKAIPLEVRLPAVPSHEGADPIRGLFGPLDYAVEVEEGPLDARFPEWENSRLCSKILIAERLLEHRGVGTGRWGCYASSTSI